MPAGEWSDRSDFDPERISDHSPRRAVPVTAAVTEAVTEAAAEVPAGETISVIIPAYNAAWCLERALASVRAQTRPPDEVVVVDDGSTDGTARLAEAAGGVRLVRQPNRGLSAARNAGIGAARGSLLAYLDADDHWRPGKLAAQAALLAARPEVGFCSTRAVVEDAQGRPVREWVHDAGGLPTLAAIFARNATIPGSGSGVMVRAAVQRRAGGFDESLSSLEDVDMWMRLAAVTEYAYLPDALTVIRRGDASMSRKLDVMRACAIRVMRKNRELLPPGLRGAFWRAGYAAVLSDYAKWEYREGRRLAACLHLVESIARSPWRSGRLGAGLLLAVATNQPL